MGSNTEQDDKRKDKLEDFLVNARDEDLKALVSANDKNKRLNRKSVNSELDDDDEKVEANTWGKAIEIGIMEKVNDEEYKLQDRSIISQYLSGNWSNSQDSESDVEEGEDEADAISEKDLPNIDYGDTKWSRYDKMAAIFAGISLVGFQYPPLRSVYLGTIGVPFDILLNYLPFFFVIFIVAIITSFWSTYVREKIVDVQLDDIREYITKIRGGGDDSGLFNTSTDDMSEREEQKIMKAQKNMMKGQIRPFGWIMMLSIPLIIWVFSTANFAQVGTITFPILGEFAWAGTVIGPIQTWIIWYAPLSAVFSQIFKKIINKNEEDDEENVS